MSRLSCTLSYSSNRGVKTEVTKYYKMDQLQDILDSPQLANDTDVQKWGETVKRMSPESTYRTGIVQNSSALQRSKKTTSDTKAASQKKRKTHHNQWEKQPRMNGRFTKGKGKDPVQQNKHASPPQGTTAYTVCLLGHVCDSLQRSIVSEIFACGVIRSYREQQLRVTTHSDTDPLAFGLRY